MEISEDTGLPALRDELIFLEGAKDGDGASGYLIFDPVRHLYFRIGLDAARAFAAWSAGTVGELIKRLKIDKILIDIEDVGALINFVSVNCLSVGAAKSLIMQNQQREKSLFMHFLHGYLFFKLPLFHPQKFLDAVFPYVGFLGSRTVFAFIGVLTIIGVYLTARQFDVFLYSFSGFANWQGALLLTIALVFLKSAHELGHAFVATAHKCRVPVIGIAFMVMVPMLYSDVSDAWRLKSRKKRLMIDGAGMMVEIAIGGIALFLWALLPAGPFRSLCLFIATTSWIMSLAVNLSPFMRFDGYHILADWLGIHNLQARGFAIGRWQLRKWLFGLSDNVPERFSPRLHNQLVAYAWGTWIYRFFLFLGIALLVYFMFFKLLGIFLMVVELVWFIGLPIFKELAFWWRRRVDIVTSRRGIVSLSLFAGLLALVFLPLSNSITVPGVLTATQQFQIFSPGPGQVVKVFVQTGDDVQKGQVLAKLVSVEIASSKKRVQMGLALVNLRLARGVSDGSERALRSVLTKEKSSLISELEGLRKREDALVLRAPAHGKIRDVGVGLASGMWVNQDIRLFHMVGKNPEFRVHGLVDETLVDRIKVGNAGVFIYEDASLTKQKVLLERIGLGNGAGRELVYLASVNEGGVDAERLPDGSLRTSRSVFPVLFAFDEVSNLNAGNDTFWRHEQRGSVVMKANRESLAWRFFSYGFSVLLRESGF